MYFYFIFITYENIYVNQIDIYNLSNFDLDGCQYIF